MTYNSTIESRLKKLSLLHPRLIDLSLKRIIRLLKKLGNPQDSLPPIIHVAGTNGKGSTIAFMRSMLESAGYKTHVYSSPHLVKFNERIYLAGKNIPNQALYNLLENVEKINGGEAITFFEISTAAAFVAFAGAPADIILLETGLGGRLDATNIIKHPLLSILTPISLDHQKFLGATVPKIAREKAGIIKPGHPCVVARQNPKAMEPILARAQDIGSSLYIQDEDWFVKVEGKRLLYSGPSSNWNLPLPNLIGLHQINNCGLALAALDRCPTYSIPIECLGKGVSSAKWPGRLQQIKNVPLTSKLPPSWELWLDGGHNQEAGRVLAHFFSGQLSEKPLYLICGMMESKDYVGYLRPLAKLARSLHSITIPNQISAAKATTLAATGNQLGLTSDVTPSINNAVEKIYKANKSAGRILICGSLYLVGIVLKDNF